MAGYFDEFPDYMTQGDNLLIFYNEVKMEKTIGEVVKAVEQLPQDQLKQFRTWFQKFDSKAWDEQIKKDIKAGKLDAPAQAAIADHNSGIKYA